MLDAELAEAFRAHVQRRRSLDGSPETLRDPQTVCDLLSESTEHMPTSLCILLSLPQGASYADGVRELRARIAQGWHISTDR